MFFVSWVSTWEKDHVFLGCEGFHNGQSILIPSFYPLFLLQTSSDLVSFFMGACNFTAIFCEMLFISVFPIMTLSVIKIYLSEEPNLHEQSLGGLDTSRSYLRFIFHHVRTWSWVDTIQFSVSQVMMTMSRFSVFFWVVCWLLKASYFISA